MTLPEKPPAIPVGRITAKPERPPTATDARWWWRAYWYADGRTRVLTLGRCTPDEAEQRAAKHLSDGLPVKSAAPSDLRTVGDLIDTYAAHIDERRAGTKGRKIAPRSVLAYNAALARLKHRGHLAAILLSAVGKEHIEAWARLRVGEGAASRTVVYDVDILLLAWRYVHDEGALTRPPPKRKSLRLPEVVDARPRRTPTPLEAEIVAERLPLRYAVMLQLLIATGARVSEIAYLEWADVDLGAGTLALGRHEDARKTGERTFPLLPEDVALLAAWRAREGDGPTTSYPSPEAAARWVIGVTPGTSVSSIERRLRELGGAFTPHGLRRMMEDTLAGSDPKVWSALLGHSAVMALKRYRSATDDDKREALRMARSKSANVLAFRRGRA